MILGKKNISGFKIVEKEEKIEYKGFKNKTDYPEFINLLKMTQIELKKYLRNQMEYYYKKEDIICEDGFLYVRGSDPICLTSHMDTTPTVGGKTRVPVIDFYEDVKKDKDGNITHTLMSPQGIGGDDRCGIWSVLLVLKETSFRPYIVFCEDEEIGCIGSSKFVKTKWCKELKECKFLIEIDRRGNNDCVFYNDENFEFHDWIENVTGYKTAFGSCSDICNLSEATQVSSVNLSSGYYNEHHLDESIVVEETLHTKDMVIRLLEEGVKDEIEQFEYIEYDWGTKWKKNSLFSWDDDYEDWYGYHSNKGRNEMTISTELGLECVGYFTFIDYNGKEKDVMVSSDSKAGCIAKFLTEHGEICWNDVTDYYFEEVA